MGINHLVPGSRIYLDTNIFIYALEGYCEFFEILTDIFDMIDNGKPQTCTSELTLAETLIKPMMDNNILSQKAYQDVVQTANFLQVVPVGLEILIEAARIRSQDTHLKLPDSIHLATAQYYGCQIFLTNDKRLKIYPGINVILLSDC
ncbi:MAG: VapC toxin family PIN domain ribonuclease [Desulfobacteraceae bacterium 4572_88]|nr:MAG: VapC toxin family PIN domain ribonuclease [Desulfobacteraceae bacterium 4572_88]